MQLTIRYNRVTNKYTEVNLSSILLLQLSFCNGRLEEFLLDRVVTASQMRSPPVSICIAAAMALFNFTQLTRLPRVNKTEPICWPRLQSWAQEVKKLYTRQELAAEQLDNVDNLVSHLLLAIAIYFFVYVNPSSERTIS